MRAVSVDEHLCNAAHHVKKDRHGIDEPCPIAKRFNDIAEALRARLAQPKPEPVAWMYQHEDTGLTMCVIVQQVGAGFEKNNPRWKKITPLYTAPPQRKWQGLTDEEISELIRNTHNTGSFVRAIEAKLKEKNSA